MRWKTNDADVFLKSGEYVDSLLIPLTPLDFKQNFKSTVTMGEYTEMLCTEIERQLHGRMFLSPNFTYLKEHGPIEQLKSLIDHATASGHFKHIFLMTSDVYWKEFEHTITGQLFWVPALPLESMDEKHRHEVIKEQVKPLFQLIFNEWQRGINS
ncbi:YpiF family protein [Fictibacillus phosphorivorans]|uniref:YpiF family protein n=1 Tax=Fictibacillus phosphorivorans TaxID=1221500 RepID=UPI00203B032F|nr:YpiF family protein [Fictibacillus phosphorivorans]MCM3718920.1 YpiF family protein [Fictibacillus phosphorivorans]MCM3776542.1 YpiF family protein [Fictibacillus phosphorivorans]